MKKIIGLAFLIFSFMGINAQQATVAYDYQNNWFNQGGTIPSESDFYLNGEIPAEVGKVSVSIYKADKSTRLYKTDWTRPATSTGTSFSFPVKYKLRSNTAYDFVLEFHRLTSQEDKAQIKSQIFTSLDGYIDGLVSVNSRKISFTKGTESIMDDLDAIVRESLVYYEPITDFEFPGFSDIVRTKIDQINDTKMSIAKVNVGKQDNRSETRKAFTQKLLNELKVLLHNESAPFVLQDAYVLKERRKLSDVQTTKSTNYLTLQGGYGAIYMDGELRNPNYLNSFYAGVVLPLGKPAFAPKFIQNASISAGVFLNNFEDENGETISGPIVNRPVYVGLGYSLVKFVKFNAGVVLLENTSDKGFNLEIDELRVRPFIGLSAQLRLSGKLD